MSGLMAGIGGWLTASVFVALLGTNLAWLATRGPAGLRLRGRLAAATRKPGAPAAAWLVTALYLLLPPFVAWRGGAISPYPLGLTAVDWPAILGAPGLLAAGIALLALAGWLVFRRSLRLAAEGQGQEGRSLSGHGVRGEGIEIRRWLAPLDAGLYQWHMAFYRAIAIGWVATLTSLPWGLLDRLPAFGDQLGRIMQAWHSQPVYWGSWLALLPIALEAALNPFARRSIRTPGRMEAAMRSIGLAIASTALFSLTRNFWLCLFCVLAVEIMIAGWFPAES